jgi:2-dehydropantoate 2-reductase
VRFVVFGAGAIGGVVGGRLAQFGHDVALVARGPHYQAIASSGLRIESPDDVVVVDVPVFERAEAVGFTSDDVILLATKSHDTLAALSDLSAAAGPATPVVCFQNGVTNERQAMRWFRHVHGAVVMCPAAHLAPGAVQAFSSPTTGLMDVGRYPTGTDDVTQELAAALNASSFASVVRPDVMRWKYGKLMLNLLNAVDASCGISEEVAEIVDRTRAEARSCLAAAGIDYVSAEEDRARRGDLLSIRPIGEAARPGGSSWQSLERRAGVIETDYLNGEIVLLGRLHGVPTPVNEVLCAVANEMARDGRAPRSLPAEELVARVANAG